MNVEVNYLAVLLAGVANMVVGYLWYSPSLFGNQWMKLMGQKMAGSKDDMGKMYGITFLGTLVMAYVLSHVMTLSQNFFNYDATTTGLTTAFWMWLGFVVPVQMTDVLFAGKPWTLFYLNAGYRLVSLLAMALVLAMMS
jgi:hypothetical protein